MRQYFQGAKGCREADSKSVTGESLAMVTRRIEGDIAISKARIQPAAKGFAGQRQRKA